MKNVVLVIRSDGVIEKLFNVNLCEKDEEDTIFLGGGEVGGDIHNSTFFVV